jgi:glycosyltransferase involved in cell wall biosynthesis
VAEAMSCGVPCVVTCAGDSALIVGDAGFASAPRDAEALAKNLGACLGSSREELGKRARLRVEENWSVARLAERTGRVLAALCEQGGNRG